MISACIGVIVNIYTGFGGLWGLFGGLAMLYWLHADQKKSETARRLLILNAFGFLKGTSLGPLIQMLIYVDPSIIITALLGTTVVFACFSLAALVAKRRSYLYLAGFLSSAAAVMGILGFMNIFLQTESIFLFQLYGGLMMFCGFVIFDSQLIIEVKYSIQ